MHSRWVRRRRRAVVALTAAAGGCALVLGACSGGAEPARQAPEAQTTTVEPTASTTSAPVSPVAAFDCSVATRAQEDLDAAYSAELERLDIDRGDPRAQSVYALVTTEQGPVYYAAVLAAAPPELTADARLVLDYYQRLASAAGDLDPGSGSSADLAGAAGALDRATGQVDDPAAGTAVVAAQERLQTAVQRSCAGESPTGPDDDASSTSAQAPSGRATPS